MMVDGSTRVYRWLFTPSLVPSERDMVTRPGDGWVGSLRSVARDRVWSHRSELVQVRAHPGSGEAVNRAGFPAFGDGRRDPEGPRAGTGLIRRRPPSSTMTTLLAPGHERSGGWSLPKDPGDGRITVGRSQSGSSWPALG